MSDDKDHKFMTTEEAQAWNKARTLRPLSPKHWMVKAARVKRMLILAVNWKRLASRQGNQILEMQSELQKQSNEIVVLNQLIADQEDQISSLSKGRKKK